MTNGEKMISAFPDGEVRMCEKGVVFSTGGWCHAYADEWWNAECEEPTTKNDLPHCQHTDEEIAKSFIEDVEAVKDQLPCFCEQMDFPSTFDEFADYYGFKDTEEVYTNGNELIQVFRVKQWLEHISTTKNDLGVDCISRQAVIDGIKEYFHDEYYQRTSIQDCRDCFIEDVLNHLPSVTPQEPRWIPVKFRPLTDEEQDEYPDYCYMADCPMPDDGEEILVCTTHGGVEKDECVFEDGFYLDSGYDWQTDILAWMPLPKPYREVEK